MVFFNPFLQLVLLTASVFCVVSSGHPEELQNSYSPVSESGITEELHQQVVRLTLEKVADNENESTETATDESE